MIYEKQLDDKKFNKYIKNYKKHSLARQAIIDHWIKYGSVVLNKDTIKGAKMELDKVLKNGDYRLDLLDDAVHKLKYLISNIAKERKAHHIELDTIMKKHDKSISKMIEEGLTVVEELYQLFDDSI